MKSLRILFLILHCLSWRFFRDNTYHPIFDDEDQKLSKAELESLRRREMRDTFINCAVDKALAQSIWNLISQNKTGKRLESLKLWPTGGSRYGACQGSYGAPMAGISCIAIFNCLSRPWLFERVPRDDKVDFIVWEPELKFRKWHSEMVADWLNFAADDETILVWEIFHSIWPAKKGSKDWRDDWSSFPLQI